MNTMMIPARAKTSTRDYLPDGVRVSPMLSSRMVAKLISKARVGARLRGMRLNVPAKIEPDMPLRGFLAGASGERILQELAHEFGIKLTKGLQSLGDLCSCPRIASDLRMAA